MSNVLKVRFTTYIVSNIICNYFNIRLDSMLGVLVVDIKQINAIIIQGIFSTV